MKSFLTTLTLASAAAAIPAAAPACGAGKTTDFIIKDFLFSSQATYSTPSHLATSEANVTFSLKLPTKPKLVSCSATTVGTYPNYFDGTELYDCVDGKTTSASFRYNSNTRKLVIKGEWSRPKEGTRFQASGHGKVTEKENCRTRTVKNPDWSADDPEDYQDIFTKCKDEKSRIEIAKISAVG